MSFFALPPAVPSPEPFSGSVSVSGTRMLCSLEREPDPAEDLFPAFAAEFVTDDGDLTASTGGLIATRWQADDSRNVNFGSGNAWREAGDQGWNRGAVLLDLK